MSLYVGFDGRGVGPPHRRFGSVFNSPPGAKWPFLGYKYCPHKALILPMLLLLSLKNLSLAMRCSTFSTKDIFCEPHKFYHKSLIFNEL